MQLYLTTDQLYLALYWVLVPQAAVIELLCCPVEGTGGGEKLAGAVKFSAPGVSSSGSGVANAAPLHPCDPVDRR